MVHREVYLLHQMCPLIHLSISQNYCSFLMMTCIDVVSMHSQKCLPMTCILFGRVLCCSARFLLNTYYSLDCFSDMFFLYNPPVLPYMKMCKLCPRSPHCNNYSCTKSKIRRNWNHQKMMAMLNIKYLDHMKIEYSLDTCARDSELN